jgi:hypothetical protein
MKDENKENYKPFQEPILGGLGVTQYTITEHAGAMSRVRPT